MDRDERTLKENAAAIGGRMADAKATVKSGEGRFEVRKRKGGKVVGTVILRSGTSSSLESRLARLWGSAVIAAA